MSVFDLEGFFRIGEFAVEATFRPATGLTKVIPVIFIKEHTDLGFAIIAADNSKPKAVCKTSDVTGIDQKSTLTIEGFLWNVFHVAQDATGVSIVDLSVD